MPEKLQILDWGRTPYIKALEEQTSLVQGRKEERSPDTLIFTEHESVYTIGSRTNASENLLWSEEKCAEKNIVLHKTNRGGDITYHGPGQLVVYPIIKLKQRDLHLYLRNLEKVVIALMNHYGIDSGTRHKKTGIWVEDRKICAIGVSVKSWITYHGIALNINPDMSFFKGIIPCGIRDGSVTSLKNELRIIPDLNIIKERFIVEFNSIFYKDNLDHA